MFIIIIIIAIFVVTTIQLKLVGIHIVNVRPLLIIRRINSRMIDISFICELLIISKRTASCSIKIFYQYQYIIRQFFVRIAFIIE